MNYKIVFDETFEIVNVIYIGSVCLLERLQEVDEICKRYSHLKPLRILVNVRELVMDLSLQEQQYLGKYIASQSGFVHAKVAVLHNPGHNPNFIVDSCAFNNGHRIAEFDKRRDAESWLLED